jgi:hypothetical protein
MYSLKMAKFCGRNHVGVTFVRELMQKVESNFTCICLLHRRYILNILNMFYPLLGAFAKLRKTTLALSCTSVCKSVHMVPLGSHGTNFHENLSLFENLSRKFKFLYSITRITGAVHKDQYTFLIIFLSIPFLECEMFQTYVVKKIKTHILCSKTFSDDRPVYKIMWQNVVEPDRPQKAIRLMRSECWISEVTDTHSEYLRLIAFPNNGYAIVSQYYVDTYIASLVFLIFVIEVSWRSVWYRFL